MNCLKGLSILLVGLGFAHILHAQTFPLQVKKGEITYVNDERGNRILDFSSCGYRSSNVPLPDVTNVRRVIIPVVSNVPSIMCLPLYLMRKAFGGQCCWIKVFLN